MSEAEFIAAVEAIIDAAQETEPLDINVLVALRRLENVIDGYRSWATAKATATS